MKKTTERKMAYGLAIILFLVGLICYAAFPVTPPASPVRIMFQSTAGEVLFDHQKHTEQAWDAISCMDCHHEMKNPNQQPQPCEKCHLKKSQKKVLNLQDAYHDQCISCHDDSGLGPVECFQCHTI